MSPRDHHVEAYCNCYVTMIWPRMHSANAGEAHVVLLLKERTVDLFIYLFLPQTPLTSFKVTIAIAFCEYKAFGVFFWLA